MRQAKEFIDVAASIAESYFNIFGAASEQSARLECENVELKEREARLKSDNAELSQRLWDQEERVQILESELKKREASEASFRSRVDMADLQKAQAELALEVKAHELARILKRISSLEATVAQREAQIFCVRTEAHIVLKQDVEATRLVELACTHDGELRLPLIYGICEKFVQIVQMRQLFYHWAIPMIEGHVLPPLSFQ